MKKEEQQRSIKEFYKSSEMEVLKCLLCTETFKTKSLLEIKEHYVKEHKIVTDNNLFNFYLKSLTKRPKRINYRCPVCNLFIFGSHELATHLFGNHYALSTIDVSGLEKTVEMTQLRSDYVKGREVVLIRFIREVHGQFYDFYDEGLIEVGVQIGILLYLVKYLNETNEFGTQLFNVNSIVQLLNAKGSVMGDPFIANTSFVATSGLNDEHFLEELKTKIRYMILSKNDSRGSGFSFHHFDSFVIQISKRENYLIKSFYGGPSLDTSDDEQTGERIKTITSDQMSSDEEPTQSDCEFIDDKPVGTRTETSTSSEGEYQRLKDLATEVNKLLEKQKTKKKTKKQLKRKAATIESSSSGEEEEEEDQQKKVSILFLDIGCNYFNSLKSKKASSL